MNQMSAPQGGQGLLQLTVRQIRAEGHGINSYEFVDPDGGELPPFEAGAHVDVHLGSGLTRQYSLSNDPAERNRYVIAVLHDPNGRGGSAAVHKQLHVRDTVAIGVPRNNFPLCEGTGKVVLVAGGIGVTPLKSMAHVLASTGRAFELHYCAKSRDHIAFADELEALATDNTVHFHYDGGDPAKSLDIARMLAERREPGTSVYYCGPGGFMAACAAATTEWDAGTVHFEHFKPPAPPKREPAAAGDVTSFIAVIQSTGQEVEIQKDQSLADALEAAGKPVETSCISGLCGACKTRYVSGEVEHNDCILSPDEQAEYLTACVSRGRAGTTLVLDL